MRNVTIRPGGPPAPPFPEGRLLLECEVRAMIHAGEIGWSDPEPVDMPGGEIWYRVP